MLINVLNQICYNGKKVGENMDKRPIPKSISYLLIFVLIVSDFFLINLLLQFPFYRRIQIALFNIFFPFLVSFLVVYIFHPLLYWVEKKFSIKTWVSTLVILFINIILLIVTIEFLLPVLATQVKDIVLELPNYIDQMEVLLTKLRERYNILNNDQFTDTIREFFNSFTLRIGDMVVEFVISASIFAGRYIWIILLIPIIVFIMMSDYHTFYNKLSHFLAKHQKSEWIQLFKNIDKKLGTYLRGQIIIMLYMFLGNYLLLLIIGMPNALIFSIIIAFANIIPYLGPYLGGIPLWIYAYFQSPYLLIGAIIIVIIMQQFDGNIGQVLAYGSQSKIHPLIIFAVMLIGSAFAGVLGLILSVPVYIIISEIYRFFRPRLKKLPIN